MQSRSAYGRFPTFVVVLILLSERLLTMRADVEETAI